MNIQDIKNIDFEKCENFSDFAGAKMPMPGEKKYLRQVLDKKITVVDFRVMASKKRQNTKCLQIQFLMDGEVYVAFTGSGVLLDQIQAFQDKLPFTTTIKKIDDYFTFA